MKISDLRPAEYNPRQISGHARNALGASMGDFGDLSGITYNLRTERLVCGHQRVDLLRGTHGDLELVEERGRMFIQLPNGDEFPVRVVDWPEDKERLANVVANNPEIAGVFTADVNAMLAGIDAKQKAAYRVDVMLENLKLPDAFIEQASQPPPQTPPPPAINWHKTTPTTNGYGPPAGESFTATPEMAERPPYTPPEPRGEAEDAPWEESDEAEDTAPLDEPPEDAQDTPPAQAEKPAEKDMGMKYPLYFVFRRADFERWKAARKALKLSDSELALHLLGQYEAIAMAQSDEPQKARLGRAFSF